MIEELQRLRVRLTAWYVGVFALVLVIIGAALFYELTRQISARLDESLADATEELQRAAEIRLREGPPEPNRVDALDELRIPDRRLFLFDDAGRLIHPDSAAPWLHRLAATALSRGHVMAEHDISGAVTWRAYARRFRLSDGRQYVGISAADVVEISRQYPALLLAFGLAAIAALALVGLGGWLLARRSTEPVRDSFLRMRGFMADAAHELRTPVAVVKGHAEVALRQPRDPDEYVEILESIHGEAARLSGILENLLTIARADAGGWPVRLEPLYLDDLLLDTVENARVIGADKGVRFDVTRFDELPIRGDPDLLRQLLMILLDNAVKFTPADGRVEVAATRNGERAEVSVTDTGIGIPASRLPHVFERFYRADDARTRTGEPPGHANGAVHGRRDGAGLGLSIARWIATVHQATIDIESEPGHGTQVRVGFPLEEQPS